MQLSLTRHDTITLTDRDTTLRTDEQFGEVPMEYDPVAMLLDETGQMDVSTKNKGETHNGQG